MRSIKKFYLQKEILPGSGAIQEANYVLFVEGEVILNLQDVDADALGEILTNKFLDGRETEIAGLFPRIASRYKQLNGNHEEMEEYLLNQLEISKEAQDAAWGNFHRRRKSPSTGSTTGSTTGSVTGSAG